MDKKAQSAGGPDRSVVPSSQASDRSLIRRFRQGRADAATEIYLRYAGRLQNLAASQAGSDLGRRVDPEDIVQSVFRTFFRRVGQGQYDVPEGEELWKLFLVIGLNKIRSTGAYHRAAKRDVRQTQGGEVLDRAAKQAAADEQHLTVLRMVVEELLSQLQPSQRNMVELRIAGYTVAEIAKQTRRSKRSVERVLQEFRQSLQALVQDDD